MSVAELLAQSRQAHQRYRLQHAGRIDRHGKVSHATQLQPASFAILEALSLRVDAERLDPQHSDPAWLTDLEANKGQTSEAMIAFLARYLTPAEARA